MQIVANDLNILHVTNFLEYHLFYPFFILCSPEIISHSPSDFIQLELFIYHSHPNNFDQSENTLPVASSFEMPFPGLKPFELQASMWSIIISLNKLFEMKKRHVYVSYILQKIVLASHLSEYALPYPNWLYTTFSRCCLKLPSQLPFPCTQWAPKALP